MRVSVGKLVEVGMEVNNPLMIPNLSSCTTDPASEPTAGPAGDVMRLAGNSMGNAMRLAGDSMGNAIAALEENVYTQIVKMENSMNARLQMIETKINTNSAEINRIAMSIDEIQSSLTALTGAVQQMNVSINARGG